MVSSIKSPDPQSLVKLPIESNSWTLVESSVATYIWVPSVVIATTFPPRFVMGVIHFQIDESKTSIISPEETNTLLPTCITEFISVPLGELTKSILPE